VICVMEGGTIIEMGSHRELFERGGAYAKFCRSQLLEPEQGYVQSLSTETPAVGQAAE
jgi:hypothetical protein